MLLWLNNLGMGGSAVATVAGDFIVQRSRIAGIETARLNLVNETGLTATETIAESSRLRVGPTLVALARLELTSP